MFKSLLLIAIFSILPVKAQVLSGHQEFVHYSSEQKEKFIIGVMELMVELENQYETAPVPKKAKYSLLLKQLNELMISSAHAKVPTDLNIYANDLTKLLDPEVLSPKRCIYAGWVSKTVTQGSREVCQHPNHLPGSVRSPETIAYKNSSPCGLKDRNTITCNPAIFGFKNKSEGSQFCVPAGPSHSENSSYACMQLAIGLKTEKGADPASERIEQLKKNFEGNPKLVNNLYGFIYKTCICDTQDKEVINPVYLSRTRPHRTCLGLVNSIAEVNHCVEFGTTTSSDMTLFKELRTFTNDIAGRASSKQVDTEYTKLLNSMKTRFSADYANICGGGLQEPPQSGDGEGNTGDTGGGKECIGECDLVDGKYTNCSFKSGEETIEATPPDDGSKEFTAKVGEENYLCRINERAFDHKTSCRLEVKGDAVGYQLIHPEGMKVEVKSTKWSPSQDGAIVESVSFGDHPTISLSLEVMVNGNASTIDCGSENNPQADKAPTIDLIPDGGDHKNQKFKTEVDPDDKGWTYQWSRSGGGGTADKAPPMKIQGDSDSEETPPSDEESTPPTDEGKKLEGNGKTFDAPKEDTPYQLCVELVNDQDPSKKSNKACKTVDKASEEEAPLPSTKPKIGGPQINMPQLPVRQGVDFSRGGIL